MRTTHLTCNELESLTVNVTPDCVSFKVQRDTDKALYQMLRQQMPIDWQNATTKGDR